MDVEREIESLLDKFGAVLTRDRKHLVYKFPDGKTFVSSSTPSDYRANLNKLTVLRRVLGIQPIVKPHRRRTNRPKHRHPACHTKLAAKDAPVPVQPISRRIGWPPKLGEIMTRDMWKS